MLTNRTINLARFAALLAGLCFSTLVVAAVQVDLKVDGSALAVE